MDLSGAHLYRKHDSDCCEGWVEGYNGTAIWNTNDSRGMAGLHAEVQSARKVIPRTTDSEMAEASGTQAPETNEHPKHAGLLVKRIKAELEHSERKIQFSKMGEVIDALCNRRNTEINRFLPGHTGGA